MSLMFLLVDGAYAQSIKEYICEYTYEFTKIESEITLNKNGEAIYMREGKVSNEKSKGTAILKITEIGNYIKFENVRDKIVLSTKWNENRWGDWSKSDVSIKAYNASTPYTQMIFAEMKTKKYGELITNIRIQVGRDGNGYQEDSLVISTTGDVFSEKAFSTEKNVGKCNRH